MGDSHRQRNPQQLMQQAQHLHQSGRLEEAATLYARLLKDYPGQPLLLNCAGLLALQQSRAGDAAKLLGLSLKINPDQPGSLLNLAVAYRKLGRQQDAMNCYDRILAMKPDFADAHNNRGNVLQELSRPDEALASYDRALTLKPDFADAHFNRGNVLQELNRLDEALASYNRALALNPDIAFLQGANLHLKMKFGDWQDFDALLAGLVDRIAKGHKAAQPFQVLALVDSLCLHKAVAGTVVHHTYPANSSLGPIPNRSRKGKIRIGYFSADFRNHPVSYLLAGVFEHHDRHKFELTAFSFGPDSQDEMRRRVSAAFDTFLDVRQKSAIDIARLSREMGIDIAIDLGGFTQNCRTGIFAARAAPIQASYIGYLGTMNANYIDYLIADKIIIPKETRSHYTEKVAYLPCYQANDSRREISDRAFSREELGLPPDAFVFCCFNNNYKITPETFDSWTRILKEAASSVLFLYAENQQIILNLQEESRRRGIDPTRLVFSGRLPRPEYLARYRAADLFLDTLPYNAGTTASDALWAGLPVLTCMGESFAGRVAASVLTAIDLPELITTTREDYEKMAVALATKPEQFATLKEKLDRNRLTTQLFDTAGFTRHLESAYQTMYERCLAGQPPDDIVIQAS